MTRTSHLRHMLRRAGMPAAVAAALLLTSGCGGGEPADPSAGPATSPGSPAAAGVVLTVTGAEYMFAPTTLTAAPGRTTIRFTNKGAMEHDFSIKGLGVRLTVQPGKAAETTVTLTPGTYKTYCSIAGHSQSGMHGTLVVS